MIRLRVESKGVTFDAMPTSEKREFLASTDNWFRPVNVANGPDGCLYVCDMYRELIEDPSAIPEDILKLMDVTSGRDRGRIYRIVHDSSKRVPAKRLGDASANELVSALESPNAWTRETAQRLLVERQDKSAIELLRKMIANSNSPKARLHALWTDETLNGNDEKTLLLALRDQHPAVREHTVRVAERHVNSHPSVATTIVALANDKSPRVRYQVAFTLGELTDRKSAINALAKIAAQNADDSHIRTAALSSVPTEADQMLVALSKNGVFKSDAGDALLDQLVGVIAARGNQGEVDRTIALVASDHVPTGSKPIIALSLGQGLSRGGQSFREVIDRQPGVIRTRIERLLDSARSIAGDPQQETERRRQAIQLLRHCPWEGVGSLLSSLLKAQEPADIQLASIRSISAFDNDEVAAHLIAGWRGLSPTVRGEAAEALLARDERATALLEAIRDGHDPRRESRPPARQQVLLQHRDAGVRTLAADVFDKIARPARVKVIENYRAALDLARRRPARNGRLQSPLCDVPREVERRQAGSAPIWRRFKTARRNNCCCKSSIRTAKSNRNT